MNIVVCVKQIPAVSEIKLEEGTGRLLREGVPSIINPSDKNALEEALKLKDESGANVIVLTMGPEQAKDVLLECLELGADEAVLLCDAKAAGSDSIVTSRVLSAAIHTLGGANIIFTGRQAGDGDTGQVGPGIAERRDIPQLTYVDKLEVNADNVIARRAVNNGTQIIETSLPLLVSVTEKANTPRRASIKSKMAAKKKQIRVLSLEDIGLSPEQAGLAGSVTVVAGSFPPEQLPKGVIIKADTPDEAAASLFGKLEAAGLL